MYENQPFVTYAHWQVCAGASGGTLGAAATLKELHQHYFWDFDANSSSVPHKLHSALEWSSFPATALRCVNLNFEGTYITLPLKGFDMS